MSAAPNFASTPRLDVVSIATANTNRDGTGTIQTVTTAGSLGTCVDAIEIQATGTTTSGMVRLYLSSGANTWLFDEILVVATTPSSTVQAFSYFKNYTLIGRSIILPAGWSIKASTNNAEQFLVFAFGNDF